MGATVNPDARKRPSPVVLRVYELKSNALFESADFVSLFEKDQAVLGAELVSREEVILQPNDVKELIKSSGLRGRGAEAGEEEQQQHDGDRQMRDQ